MRRTSLDLMSAWSAIEIALWDIVAKHARLPLYNMLGGASRERVKVYANGWSSGTETIEQNLERALKVKAMGYTALKWDPFPGPWRNFIHREDEDHVVRYVRRCARRWARTSRCWSRCTAVWRRCTRSASASASPNTTSAGTRNPACATTSNWSPRCAAHCPACRSSPARRSTRRRAFAQALAARAADIINPDICNCGGISAMLDIAAMAQPHAVAMAPHNYNSTLVGLAATVQLSAMIPNFWIAECFINLKPACDEIAVHAADGAGQLRRSAHHAGHRHRPGRGSACASNPYRDMGTRTGKGLRSYTEEFPRKNYVVGATRTGY